MNSKKITVICFLLYGAQLAAGVINNGQKVEAENPDNPSKSDVKVKDEDNENPPDSTAVSSDQDVVRREAPLELGDTYGPPVPNSAFGISLKNSYSPSGSSNLGLPPPVYGVPDSPSNNIVYPAPPPDIPPPISSSISNLFDSHPPIKYGPPLNHRPLKPFNFVPNLPPLKGPKPIYGPPRPIYGPPIKQPLFIPNKAPKPIYGPPIKIQKPFLNPPKHLYGPPKPFSTYGPPGGYITGPIPFANLPKPIYGPPKLPPPVKEAYGPPIPQYGPPQPIPHPPPPGVPAPPTPPDIKYDGWQPIPGLVSRPNQGLDFNSGHKGVSDSYGAPLNTVTGSGGIVSSSAEAHSQRGHDSSISIGLSALGINNGDHQGQLSVVKSIGYELFPNHGSGSLNSGSLLNSGDSYGTPPLNSFSPSGPYAASHSYKPLDSGLNVPFHSNIDTSLLSPALDASIQGLSLPATGIGLIPPSGLYGVPPSGGKYGTPLLSPPPTSFGAGPVSLNALEINPPKKPVVFRDPVPSGLIESIGNTVAHNDAHGIIDSSQNFAGPSYIPPPVSDLPKPVNEDQNQGLSSLYSLPHANPTSYQNIAHGSSSLGLDQDLSINSGLTSYAAPLSSIDGAYALPQTSGVGIGFGGNSHADLLSSNTYSNSYVATPYLGGHDCTAHKSQPLPNLSFGVPSINSYTESLSSLNTNIAGAYQGPAGLQGTFGTPDLQAAHSQENAVNSSVSNNLVEEAAEAEATGKSLAQNFGPDTELIRSQSIDLNNIPVQGALGSYTLQIQSADGLGGVANAQHGQVLNDGLLQTILNAIEQQPKNPLTHLIPPQTNGHTFNQQGNGVDSQLQNSQKNVVVVTPPTSEKKDQETVENAGEDKSAVDEAKVPVIDNNEIALYFANTDSQSKNSTEKSQDLNDVRNGQQYGSYVSFKTPSASYKYGEVRSRNSTKPQTNKN